MTINEKVRSFIDKNMIVIDENVSYQDTDNIFQLGFVNSLFAMKLLNFVESEFSIVIDDDELNIENFSSVEKIVSLVNRKKVTV